MEKSAKLGPSVTAEIQSCLYRTQYQQNKSPRGNNGKMEWNGVRKIIIPQINKFRKF